MKLQVSKSKNSTTYYVAKSFRDDNGKITSKVVERLGSIEEIKAKSGDQDPIEWAKKYIKELTKKEKEENRKVRVEYSPTLLLEQDKQRCYNGGYLFLQKVYHELGLHRICEVISQKYKTEFDIKTV